MKRSIIVFLGALLAVLALSTTPAHANAGKVLVFTGTAGTANASSADVAAAITALGTANDFTVDTTNAVTDINAAKLAGYRSVVFVNSSGDVLDAPAETALTDYVNGGGGFVGIGETALLEQGGAAFFNTLIGLTGATRATGAPVTSTNDVEYLDRVHPATRNLPVMAQDTDPFYTWTTLPTGTVQTVARVRGNMVTNTPGDTPFSVTNDAVTKTSAPFTTTQPQLDRPGAWCRDISSGRSFYTEIGASSASVATDNTKKLLLGAIQWAAGMVRGNCKATITSNYTSTRLTPPNPTTTSNIYTGEMTKSALADDGRIFYGGRAICNQSYVQINNWDAANVGIGCGTVHVWDPRIAGTNTQNAAKISMVANLSVYGAKNASEWGQNATSEAGLVAMVVDPKFTKGRPYMYIQYFPYYGGEQGKDTLPKLGQGFDRANYMGEKRLSRFTYDDATKSFVPGSEKVIFSYMQSVFNCCHEGAGMAFDSKGNLYITNGDNVPNGSNSTNGGYTNPDPQYTIPCPSATVLPNWNTHCAQTPEGDPLRPIGTKLYSYGDVRSTSADTSNYLGKIVRIHPLDDPGSAPGIGTTYTIPDAGAPNGANLFTPDSTAVTSGLAKPEIFAMGVRSTYTIHIDPKTDAITTAWIGPDQGAENLTWGPAKTENATMMNKAGNWGWPFCQAGNRWDYRLKAAGGTGGVAVDLPADGSGIEGAVGGGADGKTGAFFDCRGPVINNSPYNYGLKTLPAPSPVNIWYGPQGGCYSYPKNANGVGIYTSANSTPNTTATTNGISRLCPWMIGGNQAPIDGGIYRKPAGDKPDAWPSYWDGRWFLSDFANQNAARHALLMDPATQFKGGQPVAVDSLLAIIPTSIIPNVGTVFMDFGADGALYVGSYSGGQYYAMNNANMKVTRFAYTGGPDTPGPDPQAVVPATGSNVAFNIGKSGGVSYKWDFGDGTSANGASVSHTYSTGGVKTATLTVTYADGQTSTGTVTTAAVATPLFVNANVDVGAAVPSVMALTLGTSASFGSFTPAAANDYTTSMTANVLASTGNALLTVFDGAATNTGHLVNADYALPSTLQAKATSSVGTPSGAFKDVGGSTNPTSLLTYNDAANDQTVALSFLQHVSATDAIRAGRYSKTLTFTLSTTTP
jgi:glucose/arabinose dehydrogenase